MEGVPDTTLADCNEGASQQAGQMRIEDNVPDSERKRGPPNTSAVISKGARRQLDGMNNSIFEPGGSNRSEKYLPSTPSGHGILHEEIWQRQMITNQINEEARRKFEEDKTRDINTLMRLNKDLNAELNVLKKTKKLQQENNEEVTQELRDEISDIRERRNNSDKDLYEAMQRVKEINITNEMNEEVNRKAQEAGEERLSLLKTKIEAEEHRVRRLTARGNDLLQLNQEQIDANDMLQKQIMDDNLVLIGRKRDMEVSVQELYGKKMEMEKHMNAIGASLGMPIQQRGGQSSTPVDKTEQKKVSIDKNPQYRPYNPAGDRHVNGAVYDPNGVNTGSDTDGSQVGSYSGHAARGQGDARPNYGGSAGSNQGNQGTYGGNDGNSSGYPQGNHQGSQPGNRQGNQAGQVPYNRRSSMSAAMRGIHDTNPCIAGLGIDCCSRSKDGIDVMAWSLNQGARLRGSRNAARRVAKLPKPYNGYRPWKDEYQGFLDDMESSGWNKNESLPHLISWLKDGPGRLAVEQWRNQYGGNGDYDELVTCASYLFGGLVAEDPMSAFKKRTQKNRESHKIFGLELQSLLTRAQPKWRYDDEYFLENLFLAFIRGLRDPDHQKVACDAWKDDTSLVDLFGAIDGFDRKKRLLAGDIPNRVVSAVHAVEHTDESRSQSGSSAPNSGSSGEEENIGAVGGGRYAGKERYTKEQREEYRKKNKDKYRKEGSSDRYKKSGQQNKPEKEYRSKNENWKRVEDITKLPTIPISNPVTAESSPSMAEKWAESQKKMKEMEEKMDKMSDQMRKNEQRGPYIPIEDRMCFRCQGKGHRSFECPAPKPIPRTRITEEGN